MLTLSRKPSSRFLLPALLLLAALPTASFAWWDCGHGTVDLIAYHQLSPEVKAKLDALLKAHPRYKEDLLKNMPAGANEAEYAFIKAGVWPDTVRARENPMNPGYHHPTWHYTDIPYYPEGGEEKYKLEVARPAHPGEPYDAVSAWEYSLKRLNDPTVSDAERAVSLCWVLHLGGDLHQPLHNVSYFSARFPNGDKGGNDWVFMWHGKKTNLHSIWDSSVGEDGSYDSVTKLADAVTTDHPKTTLTKLLAIHDVHEWNQEGRFVAVESVYANNKLKGASKSEADKDPGKLTELPPEYVKHMTEVARTQLAIGGYRLGDTLNALTLPPGAPTTQPSQP